MNAMNPTRAIRDKFNGRRRLRPWVNSHYGGMRAMECHPLGICRFRPGEGGTVSTRLNTKLAPVSGYMRSKAYVDVVQIAVPYQAIEKLELEDQEDAGVTEMTRRRLMAKQGIGLELEGEITKAANIHPISDGGQKKVTKTARLAYLAAVNHMRLYAYFAAELATKTETAILPAILTANVLQRFNGVLEPEKMADGAINLTGDIPIKGIGILGNPVEYSISDVNQSDGTNGTVQGGTPSTGSLLHRLVVEHEGGIPKIQAEMSGVGELTLRDMVKSQKLDELVREFAGMIKKDPINGEEKVARALYGLSIDYDHNCQVLYRKVFELSAMHQRPMDGASINDVSAHFELDTQFATLVPTSELGVQLVTIVSIKPVETIKKQPDPAQTEAWELVNRVHDETELDEVLLTRRHLESDVAAEHEDQETFWVGHRALEHNYMTEGPNAQQIAATEMKSTMWQYAIPTSVTPGNVSYPAHGSPDAVSMYPFYNWNGAHAEYTFKQVAAISTTLAKGPNPVERIQLFFDDPSLVENPA